MLAERFSTYVAQEREQSQMFDELMRDMIGFPPDDKQMAGILLLFYFLRSPLLPTILFFSSLLSRFPLTLIDTLTQHQSDMDILMQELEREKSKYDHLEQQFHNLRS
jgi:hypothetical protein